MPEKGKSRKSPQGRSANNLQGRFARIFSGEGEPVSHLSISQVEALQARVRELEEELDRGQGENGRIAGEAQETTTGEERETSPHASTATGPAAIAPRSGLRLLPRLGRSRIQTRLTVLILVVTIPLLAGLTTFLSLQAGARMEAEADNDLRQANEALASSVAAWVEQNISSLKEMALQPDIRGMDARTQRPVLQAMASTHPYMYLVSTTDLAGMNVARNDDEEPKDYSDRVWVQSALAGEPVTYQSLIGKTSGQPALVLSTPILDEGGEIVGVGMFAAELTSLSEETRVRAIGETGFVYIVDADNLVLAHPDPALTAQQLTDLSAYPPVAALRQGASGLTRFTDEQGNPWRAYVQELDNGWGVIAQQPEAEILAPVRRFRSVATALILAGTAAVTALAWITVRRTLEPVASLTEGATAIAAGDLNRVVEIESQDEIGALAAAFNHMTAQLRDTIHNLELRVAERTRGLELAAEVGRTVTEKVADLEHLLAAATELIRDRFELYHTQVYLLDAPGQKLLLRAATGEAGRRLLERKHYLRVDSSSLNGKAVLERRSVLVPETSTHRDFRSNPLLPDTRSELSIPLLTGEQVIGVLDMQSDQPGAFSQANQPVYEALAGQLAIAIQNATLVEETNLARAQVEAQFRRQTEQGWQDFLNSIERTERIGYRFAPPEAVTLGEPEEPPPPGGLEVPIAIAGAHIGTIQAGWQAPRWSAREIQILRATAEQLGHHLENLRLLAQSESYRHQAEQVVRRLTREGWEQVQDQFDGNLGFYYDRNEVSLLSDQGDGAGEVDLKQPLMVRDEAIGELAAEVTGRSEQAAEIIAAVAGQLSTHIETLRLAQELQKRAAELQELDRLKTAFLANMSHELRTPLNSILGFADVMLEEIDGPLTDTMRNDLQLIQKNGHHLLHLINDVLDMAKIEAGKMNLNLDRFRVREVLEDVVSINAPGAAEKRLQLAIAHDSDDAIEIHADRTRISQVLLNVVTNAIKFTDHGQVLLSVQRSGEHALICVHDTGEGIPADKLENIFQEFTQVDSSSTRKVGGTGLGLPISRRLIEMHGGRMWAESPGVGPGNGSTFFIELPLESRIAEPEGAHERGA